MNQHVNDPYQICSGINCGGKLNIFPFMNAKFNGWMARTGTGGPVSWAAALRTVCVCICMCTSVPVHVQVPVLFVHPAPVCARESYLTQIKARGQPEG